MNFVSCVKWVKKGVAQNVPENIALAEEDLKKIIEDAENDGNYNYNSDPEDEYGMRNYDEEDDNLRATLKGMIDFSDESKKRKKNSKKRLNDDLSDDEKEDEIIKDDDNLLLVGHVDDNLSTIDVYVYNEKDGDMYIHHDLMIKSPPLCVEWLNLETASGLTNLCVVGSMNPVIELWDLDLMNCIEPVSKLGRFKKKNPHKNFGHTDAVLTVAWNTELPHILCSGSVDKTALLWDLENGKVATKIDVFTDKVQNVLWNPHSEYHLLTGCADGEVRNFDCRLYNEYQSFDLKSSVESILLDPKNEHCCYAGTEAGDIYALDFRSTVPLFKLSAHTKEVTGLGTVRSDQRTLISVSTDERLKLWSVGKSEAKLLFEEDYKLEAIHCIDTNPDYPYLVCIGGSSETSNKNVLKVINLQNYRQPKNKTRKADDTSLALPTGVVLLERKQKDGKTKSSNVARLKPKKKNNKIKSSDVALLERKQKNKKTKY